jgi:hypothetical protein
MLARFLARRRHRQLQAAAAFLIAFAADSQRTTPDSVTAADLAQYVYDRHRYDLTDADADRYLTAARANLPETNKTAPHPAIPINA